MIQQQYQLNKKYYTLIKRKTQQKSQSDRKQDFESEENKQFLEAERLSRQSGRDSPTSTEQDNILIKDFINEDDQQPKQQKLNMAHQVKQSGKNPINQQNKATKQSTTTKQIQNPNKHITNTNNNQNLEFENIRDEIANYEQIAQQTIPERRSQSKQRKDDSRDPSNHSRSPQSNTKQLPAISANQQSPLVSQQQKSNVEKENDEEYLDMQDSEQVLDSIKQIKQQYIHQLHDIENKQKQVTTPASSNFKYNVVASFNVPNEEQNILKEDSFNQDVSPQNPIENYDSPFKKDRIAQDRENSQGRGKSSNRSNSKNQKQYTEEELNKMTEKIEQNLIQFGTDGQNKTSNNPDNEYNMQVGDIEINTNFKQNREERQVRSKLENEPGLNEIQQKQMQQSLEQEARINQIQDGSQSKNDNKNINNKMIQAQQSMRSNSGQTSPFTQSPQNNREKINQSNVSNPSRENTTGQVAQVGKEILPITQQTITQQKRLSDNANQPAITNKTVQPVVATKITSPLHSRPSNQSNSPLNQQQVFQQQSLQAGQQGLLPQQVVGQIQALVGAGGQQNLNRVFSEQTQNKIAQAVNQICKQKYPEFFKNITPMEFYQSIIQRQNRLKDLTPQELEQLEADIQILKKMNIEKELQQILEQNMSDTSSPLNKQYNEENNPEYRGLTQYQRKQEELTEAATRSALEATAAAEKARKEYELQQQYFQSHLSQTQNHSLMTQQQQKEIDELKRQQEEFIKQQLLIQKQQSEYLEKLQKQQSLIIQQGEEQRKRHEEEKQRQLQEIETIERQKNLRIQEEEERLRQLREMQENIRKQIEDDLQRKKLEDEEHSRRSQALFDKEQQILGRLDNEQLKLSKLQQEYAKLEAQERENRKVRELQLLLEEESRQKEIQKLEDLKHEAASLQEQQKSNQNKSDEEITRMHQLQLKYAQEQQKQQELLDKLNSQKQMQETIIREQDIVKQQELLNQQQKIQEQQFALQQETLKIQREREELEILQKRKNEESYLIEQTRLSKIAAKEQELEMQAKIQQESLLSQKEEVQRQKQQLESQKLQLISDQERLSKKAQEDEQKLIEAEIQRRLYEQEQYHLSKKAQEEEEKRIQTEYILQQTIKQQQQLEEDQKQSFLRKMEALNKELDQKKANISQGQKSLDLGSQSQVTAHLDNTNKNQSANISPHSNRTDKIIQQNIPQNDFISINENQKDEIAKRQNNTDLSSNNQNLQQNTQTSQKNVDILNQIDKLLQSANQSRNTSPMNPRSDQKVDNEDIQKSNRFEQSSVDHQQPQAEVNKQQHLISNDIQSGQNTYQSVSEQQGSLILNNQQNPTLNNSRGDLIKSNEPQSNRSHTITAQNTQNLTGVTNTVQTQSKNPLPQTNSYLPITQIQNQQKGTLNTQISNIEEKMNQINQQMQPFSVNQPSKIGEASHHMTGGFGQQYNASQLTTNVDGRSQSSSNKRDPINQTTSQTSGYIQGLYPTQSLNNPVALNSISGVPSFSGIPLQNNTPQINQVIPNNTNQNSLFVSFSNNKQNQGTNILQSSHSEKGQNSQGINIGQTPSLLNNQIQQQASNIFNPTIQTQIFNNKAPLSYNSQTILKTSIDPQLQNTLMYSPRTQELNQYRLATTPTTNILPSSRVIGTFAGTSIAPHSVDRSNALQLSVESEGDNEERKRSANNLSSKFLNIQSTTTTTGYISYKKKIKIQPAPQVIKETRHPVIRNNSSNNSKDSSFFLQNNSFSQINPKLSSNFGGNANLLNTSNNNSFNKGITTIVNNNVLNSSINEDNPKQVRNFSEQPRGSIYTQSGVVLGGLVKNTGSQNILSQFNTPISNRYVSIAPSQNSIHNLNCISPSNDNNGVSLFKKTNVTVVHTPEIKGAVSLVRTIQNTYTYNEPSSEDSFHNNSSINNNQSILDSQASQYMHHQNLNSKQFSPIRKQIIIKKSDRLNIIPINTQQKYYGRNLPILEDLANEGSDQESNSPKNKQGEKRDEKLQKMHKLFSDNNKSDTVIDEQSENKCNIY